MTINYISLLFLGILGVMLGALLTIRPPWFRNLRMIQWSYNAWGEKVICSITSEVLSSLLFSLW